MNDLYITSDLHFFHKNIIEYCNRPYEKDDNGVAQMNEDILREFDKLPPYSKILNLGDLYVSSAATFDDVKKVVDRMKDEHKELYLLLGNHDRQALRFMNNASKMNFVSLIQMYSCLGFTKVFTYPIVIGNKILSHEPVYLNIGNNMINIHGHTHEKDADFEDPFSKDNYINVCWDKNYSFLQFNDITNI